MLECTGTWVGDPDLVLLRPGVQLLHLDALLGHLLQVAPLVLLDLPQRDEAQLGLLDLVPGPEHLLLQLQVLLYADH